MRDEARGFTNRVPVLADQYVSDINTPRLDFMIRAMVVLQVTLLAGLVPLVLFLE